MLGYKKMKKSTKIAIIASAVVGGVILCFFFIFWGGCIFLIASQYGNGDTVDGFFMAYSKFKNDAFVGDYSYVDGEMSFAVPDEYCGYKVTHLGGYYGTGLPCPFGVSLPAEYNGLTRLYTSSFPQDGIYIETLCFTVYLGKNISDIKNVSDIDDYWAYGESSGDDGEEDTVLKYYKVEYYFVVSADNQYFYASEDGVLRNKSDGTPAILFE